MCIYIKKKFQQATEKYELSWNKATFQKHWNACLKNIFLKYENSYYPENDPFPLVPISVGIIKIRTETNMMQLIK